MKHLHDELDENDLKFLDRYNKAPKDKKHDQIDQEGIEQMLKHDPMNEDAPKPNPTGEEDDGIPVPVEMEGIPGDQEGEGEGDGQGQGNGQGNSQGNGQGNSQGNGDGQGNGEEGEGEEKSEQGENSEKDGDSESEEDGDEDNDRQEEDKPECDGDCDPKDDPEDDKPECPYCKEKQRQKGKKADNPVPIAVDAFGRPIYHGTEIGSCGDGSHQNKDDRYVGIVMGIAFGHDGDEPNVRMLVVKRRDHVMGDYQVHDEREIGGWGVRANLCETVEREQEEHKHDEDDNLLEDLEKRLQEFLEKSEEDDDPDQDPGEGDEADENEQKQSEPEIPMSKEDHNLFDSLFEKIADDAKESFVTEVHEDSAKLPGGVFDGEEVAKYRTIVQGGVEYRITLSARRQE